MITERSGRPEPMVWTSAVFLAVTAVLTIAAWRFRSRLKWPLAEPRDDRVDRWLIQHYRLANSRDRDELRDAVREGRAVGDPALREAAHGLAAELLSGRLRDPNPGGLVIAGLSGLGGALYLGTGLIHGGRGGAFSVFAGTMWLLAACGWVWGWSRLPRRRVEQALQLNKSDMDSSAFLPPWSCPVSHRR
jgi:hypothetical protein